MKTPSLYNRLDNGARSKWNEQVHMARKEFEMHCIDNRMNLMVIEDLLLGVVREIARRRLTIACLPVIHGIGRIEKLYGCLKKEG